MHVVLIHQSFVGPGEPGGTRHFELASRWVDAERDFTIVTGDCNILTGKSTVARRRLVQAETRDGVRILRASTLRTLNKSFVWRIVSFLSFMVSSVWAAWRAGPVELVMGTSPPLFQGCSAWLISVLRRRPFLLEIRDLWPEFAIDLGVLTNPVLIAAARRLEHFLYARATHLLVNSPAYRDYLIQHGVPAEKISLIANGADPAMFDPEAKGEEFRARWGLGGKFVVIYAGALGLANDIPTILRAADRCKEDPAVHFVLVGDGKERSNLQRMADEMGLSNVTFVGTIPKVEMAEALAAADAGVATLVDIPMFGTTYPNKVFDYMAAGRPVLLAIDGVIRQVVEAAAGGIFVSPGSDEQLAAAVRRLIQDPQAARQMGHAGRAYVVEHFNRNQQAQEFIDLLERLVQAKCRRGNRSTVSENPPCVNATAGDDR